MTHKISSLFIDSAVSDHSESITEEPEDDAQDEGYGETEAEAAANERGSLPLGGCEVGEEEQRRLDQEFEEAFSSEQFSDPMPQFGGEKRREREGRNQSDPRMVDISSEQLDLSVSVLNMFYHTNVANCSEVFFMDTANLVCHAPVG